MLSFKEELKKYKPVLAVEDVEQSIYSEEISDLLEVLQYMNQKIKQNEE